MFRSGTITRSGGLFSAIAKHSKLINIKPVNRITFQFDPFSKNSTELRRFIFQYSIERVKATNVNCKYRTNIVCDGSPPQVVFDLTKPSGEKEKLTILCENLTCLELLQLTNKHIGQYVVEPEETSKVPLTKSAKAVQKQTKRR
ncbi:39S ribosomal protein L53, mitochondrial [Lutzomyia longipalpis]|uniref:Large ribosomal subunit protein mL53 n=1 Tax=Lutzomyia longipalpis TaxID=7200 RepID=A0A1B0CD32_LUTLO|nr:39S ribosomal protein L53, mitochondrial [Lutzomyia longipalpis]